MFIDHDVATFYYPREECFILNAIKLEINFRPAFLYFKVIFRKGKKKHVTFVVV